MMGVTQAAGLSLKWFCGQFCQDYMVEAERQGRDVYDLVNEVFQEIKPGSDRLIYLPYLMGERTPHLIRTAAAYFSDCRPSIRKSHLLRAVMEGVAYSLFDCSEILGDTGVKNHRDDGLWRRREKSCLEADAGRSLRLSG